MSPTIRIDRDVFEALKTHAEPLVDTPNSVLRRVLGLPSGNGAQRLEEKHPRQARSRKAPSKSHQRRTAPTNPRAKPGSILSEDEYELPLLSILEEKGGRAPIREVINALGKRLDGRLTPTDLQKLASGNIRWRNRAQFVRLRLVEAGDMVKDSPRGLWEISEQGRRRLKATR